MTTNNNNERNWVKLTRSPLNRQIRFQANLGRLEALTIVHDRRHKKTRRAWRAISGLLERLAEAFYPHYAYLSARNTTRRRARQGQPTVVGALPTPTLPATMDMLLERVRLGVSGQQLGELVDHEVTRVVNAQYLSGAARVSVERQNDSSSLYTRRVLDAFRAWKWKPVYAQFNVFAPDLRVGTRIDMLCYDNDLHLIVVELKYGYDGYREQANAMMNAPLADKSNCPQNQHILQVGLGALMLEHHWKVKVHAGVVVYITDAAVIPVMVPEWFYERKDAIWEHFVQQMKARL